MRFTRMRFLIPALATGIMCFSGRGAGEPPTLIDRDEEVMEIDVTDFKPAYVLSGQRPPAPLLLFAYYTFVYDPTGKDPCQGKTKAVVRDCQYENGGKCADGKQITHVILTRKNLPRGLASKAEDKDYDTSGVQPIYVSDGNGNIFVDHYYFHYETGGNCLFANSLSVKAYTTNSSTNCTRHGLTTSITNIRVKGTDILQ